MSGPAVRAWGRVLLATLGLAASACHDGLLYDAAPREPAQLAITPHVAAGAGGAMGGVAEAYAAADRISLVFVQDDELRLQRTMSFDPTADETRIPLAVPLEADAETFVLHVELLRGGDALFRGSAQIVLTTGRSTPVDVPLQPVAAHVVCTGPVVLFDAIGATQRVDAVALFATQDTIPNASIAWTSQNAAVATVDGAGTVTAAGAGETAVQCSADAATDARPVRVAQVVTSVEVTPAQAVIGPGQSQPFTAVLRDRLGHTVTGRRPVWSSSNVQVASIDTAGVATAVSDGTVTIRAAADSAAGTAALTVRRQPPVGATQPATAVQPNDATLNGTVNPRGTATQVWFEWGTTPTLTSFTQTPPTTLTGTSEVPVSQSVGGLLSNVTYYFRIVASNNVGTVRGDVANFTTAQSPTVITGQASYSTGLATLRGTVNPNGAATQLWFEYGASPDPATFTRTPEQSAGAGRTAVAALDGLTGLPPDTDHYFRIAARNTAGTAFGDVVAFRTAIVPGAPFATTLHHDINSDGTLVIGGRVDPNHAETTVRFEISLIDTTFTDPDYSWSTPQEIVPATAGETIVTHGISPVDYVQNEWDRFYYRVIATNAHGTAVGETIGVIFWDYDGNRVPDRPAVGTPRPQGGGTAPVRAAVTEPIQLPPVGGTGDENGDRS